MLTLRTIGRPKGLWPSREYLDEIRQEAREMGLLATALRAVIEEERENGAMGEGMKQALHHLCCCLEPDVPASEVDGFGIQPPSRWEPWYTAHLFRTAVHFLERGQAEERMEGGLHRRIAANLAGLAARGMYLQAMPGARRTMDAVLHGRLGR